MPTATIRIPRLAGVFIFCTGIRGCHLGFWGSTLKTAKKPRFLCAVKVVFPSAGINPARQLSFWPVAIGVVVEVTKLPKPSMERSLEAIRELVGRNVSER